jgi:hypothetical protein
MTMTGRDTGEGRGGLRKMHVAAGGRCYHALAQAHNGNVSTRRAG